MSTVSTVVDCGVHSFKAGCCTDAKPGTVLASHGRCHTFQQSLADEGFWDSLIGNRPKDLTVSLPLWTCRQSREAVCEFLFESMEAKSLCLVSSAFVVALSTGKSSCLVIDIGASGTSVVPVEDGYPLTDCAVHGRNGGQAVDGAMSRLMQDSGTALPGDLAWTGAGLAAKEELAWVAPDFTKELENLKQGGSQGPRPFECDLVASNGKRGRFQACRGEGFKCGELLFDPSRIASLSGKDFYLESVPELVLASLRMQSNINLRGQFLQNLVLVGGMTQLPGLPARLASEIRRCSRWVAPGQKPDDIEVHAPENRQWQAWLGGVLLAQCSVSKDLTITKEAYNSCGPGLVHASFM